MERLEAVSGGDLCCIYSDTGAVSSDYWSVEMIDFISFKLILQAYSRKFPACRGVGGAVVVRTGHIPDRMGSGEWPKVYRVRSNSFITHHFAFSGLIRLSGI